MQKLERQLGDALAPFGPLSTSLITMPGLSETSARVLVAEIGTGMTRFPTAGHLVSSVGLFRGWTPAPANATTPASGTRPHG